MDKLKLQLEVNTPTKIKLLYDQPVVGESNYGKYYLYAVKNGNDTDEFSFFAPDAVHEVLKNQKKGTEAIITKLVTQGKGKKLNTIYDVQIVGNNDEHSAMPGLNQPQQNPYLENMLASFADAMIIQERFQGMANVNQLAVTMFIQRTKGNGFAHE